MFFNVVSAKLTGNPDSSGWSQVHDFKPEEPEKLQLRGHLFAVISTQNQESGVDSVAAGRELISRLHEEYFGYLKGGAFEALKSAVEKVVAEFSPSWDRIEVAAVSSIENVVYSVAAGGAQVAIFRDGMLAKILVSQAIPISASGYPKEGDILIVGTENFFNSFPPGIIKAAVESKAPAAAVEALAPGVLAREDKGALGVVFLKFEKASAIEEILAERQMSEPARKTFSVSRTVGKLKLIKNILSSRISKSFPERKVYVKGFPEEVDFGLQKRKLTASVGILLLGVLVISIFFGVREKIRQETKARYGPTLVSAEHELEESISLATLNPQRARELFVGSRDKVNLLLSEKVEDSALTELKKKLDENAGKVLGEFREEPELFLNLSLLSSGFEGAMMVASDENLFVLDIKGRRIIKISFATKRSEVVAGPNQVEEAQGLTAYSERVFLLNSKGVFELEEEVKKVVSPEWGGQVFIYAYAGNLYILDKGSSTIWRYMANPPEFSSKKDWFAPGIKRDLSDVISWSIDGSIWLLRENGTMLKFTNGNPQSFDISGVSPPVVTPKAIYTNEDLSNLYILDSEGSRIIVLTKTGECKAQYIDDKIKEAKNLVVSEKEKKIILLTQDKLFSIELKHLNK